MKKFLSLLVVGCAVFCPLSLNAAMSSTNYYIYADAIDTGGVYSAGGAYSLQSSLGESPVGLSESGVYAIRGGYQAMEKGSLSITIASSSLSLGTLSTTTVRSASTTVTVSTNSANGYQLSIGSATWGSLSLTSVSGGTVDAGSEEYGLAVAGAQSAVAGDVAIVSSLLVASSTVAINNSESILTFKASMAVGTTAGDYSQAVSLTASANL